MATSPRPEIEKLATEHPISDDYGQVLFLKPGGNETIEEPWLRAAVFRCFDELAGGPHGKPGPKFYENWPGSAFSDAYFERIAETEIDTLKLGHGPGTDFLGISFSALDIVGHAHGPDSSEVESILRLLDATLGALFERLDKSIGAGNYAVAFSADHGVAPIPENVERLGRDAGTRDIGTNSSSALRTCSSLTIRPDIPWPLLPIAISILLPVFTTNFVRARYRSIRSSP